MGLDVFEKFATDEVKECQGVELPIGSGAYVTVARIGNDNYTKAITSEYDKFREQLELLKGTKEGDELDRRIAIEIEADTILLGFKGIDFKGKSLKYSRAAAIKLLELKEFRSTVMRLARNIENFRVKMDKDDKEN